MYLQISDLSKAYLGQDVLKNISFIISGNEKVGLLGKNGSGKSTLLKIIRGEEEADTGYIVVSPKESFIGYLPQITIDNAENALSAGERAKKSLKELLETNPQMLLLDEPTNHLDWSGLEWLKETVNNFLGPVLIISHDRYFLDETAQKIIEIENSQIKIYGGNYTFFRQQKTLEKEALERQYFEQQKQVTRLEERIRVVKTRANQLEKRTTGTDYYVRRKAAKAVKSALNIEKRIAREIAEAKVPKPEAEWELRALFQAKRESSQTVIYLNSVCKSFDAKQVVDNVSFLIKKGQRVALVGDNGSGKTTLVKLILGYLQSDLGEVTRGNNVDFGYLSQEHQELGGEGAVIDELVSKSVSQTDAYKLLHRFLLPQETMKQTVSENYGFWC